MRYRSILVVLFLVLGCFVAVSAAEADIVGATGTVTTPDGTPLAGVRVHVQKVNDDGTLGTYYSSSDYTGADGKFSVGLMEGVRSSLRFSAPSGYASVWYGNAPTFASSQVADLTAAGPLAAYDAVVGLEGSISGTVTEAATGLPAAGVRVTAHVSDIPGAPYLDEARIGDRLYHSRVGSSTTDSAGVYTLEGLPAYDYDLHFVDFAEPSRYAWDWSGGVPNKADAVTVSVSPGAETVHDAQLAAGGRVFVVATDIATFGTPGSVADNGGMCVDVYTARGDLVLRKASHDVHWVGLRPGRYRFRFFDCHPPLEFVEQWLGGGFTEAEAPLYRIEVGDSIDGTLYTSGRCGRAWPTIIGTTDDDQINGTNGRDVIASGLGADNVAGRGGNDLICLGDGDDTGSGGTGRDVIYGGAGADLLRGGDDRDVLYGGDDADRISGAGGDDRLIGQGAADRLDGGPGDDKLIGGPGLDIASFTASATAVTVSLAAGRATGEGTDRLLSIANVFGSDFADVITGDDLANRIVGGGGNDRISGRAGNDILVGSIGDDHLNGGDGTDTLRGGPGSDTCVSGPVYVSC
jgi:Ca2+-binding RTX toxin-like protein